MTSSRRLRPTSRDRGASAGKSARVVIVLGVAAGAVAAWQLGSPDPVAPRVEQVRQAPSQTAAATPIVPVITPAPARPGGSASAASAPEPRPAVLGPAVIVDGVRVVQNGPGAFEGALQQAVQNGIAERAALRASPFAAP